MRASALAIATLAPLLCSADEEHEIGIVGPVHGAWSVNGKPAVFEQPVPAGATFTAAKSIPGYKRSIAIYMYDGRLVTKTCTDDTTCAQPLTVDSASGKDFVDPDMQAITAALVRYHVPATAIESHAAADVAPADGIVHLQDDGTLVLEPIFADVADGTYRLEFQRLDPANAFTKAAPIFKTYAWSSDGGPLTTSTLSEGLYSLRVFARDTSGREIGAPAWIFVTNKHAHELLERFVYVSALTATWEDDEARRTFLRAYLTTVATTP